MRFQVPDCRKYGNDMLTERLIDNVNEMIYSNHRRKKVNLWQLCKHK